jgi:hypothetical protein
VLSLSQGTAVAPGPIISAAQFDGRKNLTISGSGFGAGPRVLINSADLTGQVRSASDGLIKIKGKAKVLGLQTGNNMIQVMTAGGAASNVFILTL